MIKYIAVLVLFLGCFLCKAQHFGEREHPMNRETPSLEVLSYWHPGDTNLQEVYATAHEILKSDKYRTFADLSVDVGFKQLAIDNNRILIGGPLLGQVHSTGISVWVRTLYPAKVEIKVQNQDFIKMFGPVYTDENQDLSAVIEINGLESSRRYSYTVFVDGEELIQDQKASFTTVPEGADTEMRLAFGSCPHRWGLGHQLLWDQIASRSNSAMILLGDIAVQDRNDHLGMHRSDYLLRDLLPSWKKFSSHIPVYASWDDHDYFDNDLSGIPDGFTDMDRRGVREVFINSWVNRSYGEHEEGIYLKDRIGPFDLIMTDNRYFREGKPGSFLGRKQMNWLKKELLNCDAPFIILSCGSMWSDYVSDGKDSWGVNDPDGREEIFSFIEKNDIKGVIFISGDRHGARGFTIPRKSGFQFYEFEPGSLGARIGPPARKPEWDTQLFGIDGQFAFGELTYIPSDNDPSVVFRLITDEGEILFEKEIHRSELTPSNY